MRSPRDLLADNLHDLRMSVTDDHHAEAVVEVDVLVAVGVPDPAALAVIHEDGLGCRILK